MNHTLKTIAIAMLAIISASGVNSHAKDRNWDKLNAQAQKEYLQPIRPGGVDGSPFWNIYSYKFTYAPAFDFPEVDGAVKYRFRIYDSTENPCLLAEFVADSPKASLSAVWSDIKPGNVKLVVDAIDRKGNTVGEAGSREFLRDFPFHGPYQAPARNWREAGLKALLYVHNLPCIRAWAEGNGPDMSYPMHGYVCKVIGATVRIECLLAREFPELREEAMARAFGAAKYLVDTCEAAHSPLEGWPPTYGRRPNEHGCYADDIVLRYVGTTMTAEAITVGEAYLDMFDATADSVWLERSLRVARTYARIQTEEGTWPVKMNYNTGEPACQTRMFPTHIMSYLRRFRTQYGMTEFVPVYLKAVQYMRDKIIPGFDMTGQFEDNLCDWTDPYSNLTNVTGSCYAACMLMDEDISDQDARDCIDMVRLSEDQFAHWDVFPDYRGFKRTVAPCVHEQHAYEEAIDDSAAEVAEGFMSIYRYNGDPLALAKAQALLGSITRAQYSVSGRIPTVMAYNEGYDETINDIWFNCSFWCAKALLRMDSIVNPAPRN